ncbi:MAG TPA: DUF11 domain-containing protein [bacterium]|nr:DUF11 domain-containing protein [bacterium]
MKRKRFALTGFFIIVLFALVPLSSFAQVSAVTITSVVPPSPGAGDLVTVNFSYNITDNPWNHSRFLAAVSTVSTLQGGNTAGQTFKVTESGINVGGTGDGAPAVNGGYNMNDGTGVLGARSGSFTFNIPSGLEGGTYFIIIGGRQDWLDTGGSPAASQNFYQINIPLPPPDASISKMAEGSIAEPGSLILYTINYSFINGNNFVITDQVPANCALLEMSPGGMNGGTTPGSALSWNIGDATTRRNGNVWFLVQVDPSAVPGTIISNTASWTLNEIPGGGSSNTASVTVGEAFNLVKSQSASTASVGDNITYTFDFAISGLSLEYYDSFDTDITGYFATGGIWNWEAETGGGGYINSPAQGSYPHYLRNTPTDFCYGMITADVWIGNKSTAGSDFWDSLVVFRDNGLTGGGARAYGLGISSDNNPGSIYLQKAEPYLVLQANNTVAVQNQRWYTLKISVTDAGSGSVRIQGKAWLKGTAEPAGWNIDYTDISAIPACGFVGFQGHPLNPNLYDNMKIFRSSVSANDAVLYDTIPAGLSYLGGTPADGVHGGPIVSGGIVRWELAGVVDDYAGNISWWAQITDCGLITNTGAFKPNAAEPPILSNSVVLDVECPGTPTFTPTSTMTHTVTHTPTFTVTVTFTPTVTMTATPTVTPVFPNISLSKSAAPLTVKVNDTVTFTVNYSNTGAGAATNAVITDNIPQQLICSPPCSEFVINNGGVRAGDTITWNVGIINPGASGSVSFTAVIPNYFTSDTYMQNIASLTAFELAQAVDSNTVQVLIDLPELQLTPVTNYPNPFDGETKIVFNISIAALVNIKFFTISGEHIATIKDYNAVAGVNEVEWKGVNDYGERVSSGVYFYRVEAVNGEEKQFYISRLAVMR